MDTKHIKEEVLFIRYSDRQHVFLSDWYATTQVGGKLIRKKGCIPRLVNLILNFIYLIKSTKK